MLIIDGANWGSVKADVELLFIVKIEYVAGILFELELFPVENSIAEIAYPVYEDDETGMVADGFVDHDVVVADDDVVGVGVGGSVFAGPWLERGSDVALV